MTKVILDIQNEQDLQFLLPLLQRLGIRLSIAEEPQPPLSQEELRYHHQIIDRGANRDDFADFLKDFEESRKDRELPGREN